LRQATFAHWSAQDSPIHRLDARVKLLILLAFVASLALLRTPSFVQLAAAAGALVTATIVAKLPVWRVLRASLVALPFVGLFSIAVYLGGDARRASLILLKSYLSACAALVIVASTPFDQLLRAARYFRVPPLLVEVTQLIYRYIFVLSGEAQVMRTAFLTRGGRPGRRALVASSGMIAVLFQRSYEKAAAIHNAMSARGFSGRLHAPTFRALTPREVVILFGVLGFAVILQFL
jgi:cobalt/nickel transport system permease protein